VVVEQLVEQSTNNPKFMGLKPAVAGTQVEMLKSFLVRQNKTAEINRFGK
jgi:hypothetical protein